MQHTATHTAAHYNTQRQREEREGGGEIDRERRGRESEGRERREGGWDAKEGERAKMKCHQGQERGPANRVQICESEFV